MAKPNDYDSDVPKLYSCIVCGLLVSSEALKDQYGNVYVYAPVSRYWCDEGVLCGSECSLKWHDPKSHFVQCEIVRNVYG